MPAKLLVIGLDAMEPQLVERWSAEGGMETLARLTKAGAYGRVSNPSRFYSGASWPNFWTGMTPDKHQQYLRIRFNAETYNIGAERPEFTCSDPFWTQPAWSDKRLAIVNMPYNNILNKDINALQVQDMDIHDRHTQTLRTYPGNVANEILDLTGRHKCEICDRGERTLQEHTDFAEELIERVKRKVKVAEMLLEKEDWDMFLYCFDECHCAGHIYWHQHDHHNVHHDPKLFALTGNVIKKVYEELDAGIARILAMMPSNSNVVVVGSHGMGPAFDPNTIVNELIRRMMGKPHRENNYYVSKAKRISQFRNVYDSVPGILRNMLQPVKKRFGQGSLDKQRLSELAEMPLFKFPTNGPMDGIRLNIKGREGHGKPLAEVEKFLERLIEAMSELTEATTGEPVFEKLVRFEDEDILNSYDGDLPDYLIQWRRADAKVLVSPKYGKFRTSVIRGRSGDHDPAMEGFFIASGPYFSHKLHNRPVELEDFAPTFSRILNIDNVASDGTPICKPS